ncbi:acyltransferase [Butyrivibrio sp. INlla16]|uniref:acyltransferase n=1 Tax=Butyrivibrio sp. INlla16 TaxID=1520807 RepID=UPI000882D69C|nr:acyltransferase family protein [Butyrivibrio sp. INlla16]SDB02338.1 Surface polysaccharide O-acyltransferase, integral membrane enzyme [Butyrivibrio sp. INlla16]
MSQRPLRESNIELLRIMSACGVIMLHYNSVKNGGFAGAADGSINQFILVLLEAFSICAVNVFVLITGYFMCKVNKRDGLKPLSLVMQVLVFALITVLAKRIFLHQSSSIDDLFEYVFSGNWFVYVFVALYFISPFINIVWEHLDVSGRKLLIGISFVLFSVYPTVIDILKYWSGRQLAGSSTIGIDGAQAGYTIVNFVLVYLIGAGIRDMDEKHVPTVGHLLFWYILSILVTVAWSYADGIRAGKNIYDTIAWNYNNPLIISQAALLFMMFRKIKITNNRIINAIAGGTFTVYILNLRLVGFLDAKRFAGGDTPLLILHIIGSIIGIYVFSYICYVLYLLIKRPIYKMISEKWYRNRRFTV